MVSGGLRRSNLISPFGPGSLTTLVDGTSVVVPGIDAWYLRDGVSMPPVEATLHEPRLQRHLRVGRFVLPPAGVGTDADGTSLTLPAARFPTWSFCQYCKRLHRHPLTQALAVRCEGCAKSKGKTAPRTSQVPFLVVCEGGHMSDFPWNEWVHKSAAPECGIASLYLKSSGTGDLSGQVVSCKSCGAVRNLLGITQWTQSKTKVDSYLSAHLLGSGKPFVCSGTRPWLYDAGDGCGHDLVAVLRSASNIYFANVESAIFVPSSAEMDAALLDLLSSPLVEPLLNFVANAQGLDEALEAARATMPDALMPWPDDKVKAAIASIYGGGTGEDSDEVDSGLQIDREPEWQVLRNDVSHPDLVVRVSPADDGIVGFGRRASVPVLKETRALTGFGRLKSTSVPDIEVSKALLRRTRLHGAADWLPAYVVRGEGVYLELDLHQLARWEKSEQVLSRTSSLARRLSSATIPFRANPSPRFVLLHTLAHVLINQMVLSSGYSSASLRERVFSGPPGSPMAGLLIYTASGDSDGTLGGLVRLGETAAMKALIREAVESMRWCANDPVCMELGESGQGPEGCNSSACHSCCLLPETACEHFNRALDRALIVGTLKNKDVGYFALN